MRVLNWLIGPEEKNHFLSRWIFLRALGLIYFSAFYSLLFQVKGLIGPRGILPATMYLPAVAEQFSGWQRFWFAPTLLWWSSGDGMLMLLSWIGLVASAAVILNLWPRAGLLLCFVCFLSFVAAAQEFSGYQSDGMLLEAGFISLFFAPAGLRPRLGTTHPPSRLSLFLLRWEWFRIYFESGIVKVSSGDYAWRHLTAMDDYYQNNPLPTWFGWYVQHLPHWFHAATVYATLALELGLVWMLFLPQRWRTVCFFIVTPWQIGVILTANYTFLNYLVLALGFLLLDDGFFEAVLPKVWAKARARIDQEKESPSTQITESTRRLLNIWKMATLASTSLLLTWIAYATTVPMGWMFVNIPLPTSPVTALEPFRIANRYGLFAVMTRGRYEIEFQGSNDGQNWTTYTFRNKPQALNEAPRIYAPYQPRFDWNLWFASLGTWRDYPIVPNTEIRLLQGSKDVIDLFKRDPFFGKPPTQIRAVLWQYWFTSMEQKRTTGMWWRRELVGLYAPTIERTADGQLNVVEWPNVPPRN